jgi:hypothetical protein
MKAMLWKELQENFKWAVLAMIGLGLAEFYGLTERSNYYDDESATLYKSSFLMSTSFGCAAVGLILGLIQILPEQRRDQWAALLHRPVTRATIFRGKAFAGILLYLVATVPPFLTCIWYTTTPGHFSSPFVPQMVYPGVADICAGAMYYFAALFVGLRRGAWYGTRAFGFLAAVVVSFFVDSEYYSLFRVPVEAAVLMALVLFTAGWGAILTNGTLRDQPWLGRFALVTVIFYGVCGLGAITIIVISMFSIQNYYYGTQYQVDVDGRPLKFISSKNAGTTVMDLSGNIIHDKRFTTGGSYNYLLCFNQVSTYIGDPHQLKDERNGFSRGYRTNQTYVIIADGSYDNEAERWYYLPQERQFVGYYYKTNQRIGAIGQNGFRPGYEPAAPFAGYVPSIYGQIQSIVEFGSTVYHNDFDQRKLTPILSEPGTDVFGATPLRSYQDQTLSLNWGAVALLDKMLIIDKIGSIIATLPYHQNMDRWGNLSVAVKPGKDHFFIQYEPSQWIDYKEQRTMPSYYEEMDAKGTLLNTYTLPPIEEPSGSRSWQEYIAECLLPPAFLFGDIGYEKVGALCGSERLAKELDQTFGDGWGYFKDISIRSSVTSFLLALLTIAWTRRMHFSWKRAWAWAAFVLAFNLAGLITFRLVSDWPVRVKCPQCSRKRPVEENLCPHCGASWPTPVSHGTEIFDLREAAPEAKFAG